VCSGDAALLWNAAGFDVAALAVPVTAVDQMIPFVPEMIVPYASFFLLIGCRSY